MELIILVRCDSSTAICAGNIYRRDYVIIIQTYTQKKRANNLRKSPSHLDANEWVWWWNKIRKNQFIAKRRQFSKVPSDNLLLIFSWLWPQMLKRHSTDEFLKNTHMYPTEAALGMRRKVDNSTHRDYISSDLLVAVPCTASRKKFSSTVYKRNLSRIRQFPPAVRRLFSSSSRGSPLVTVFVSGVSWSCCCQKAGIVDVLYRQLIGAPVNNCENVVKFTHLGPRFYNSSLSSLSSTLWSPCIKIFTFQK